MHCKLDYVSETDYGPALAASDSRERPSPGRAATVLAAALLIAASGAVAGSPGPEVAESTSSTGASSTGDLAEVLVSARKITERVQDVPASVVALDSGALEAQRITTLSDLGHAVPGLSVGSGGPGRNVLVIRGLSSRGGQSMVGYYIDDTPIAAQASFGSGISDPALFDLARVEVLRGPQGTLYGASSMGGTIKYVTQQPELNKFSGSTLVGASDTEGGGPNAEVNSIINLPLVNDLMAVRAGFFYRYNEGYIDRYNPAPQNFLAVTPGVVSTNVNTETTYGGRVALTVQPTDWLTISPSALVQRMRLGGQFSFDYPTGSFKDPIQSRYYAEPSIDNLQMYALTLRASFDKLTITSSTSYFNRINDQVEDGSKETYFIMQPAQTSIYPVPFNLNFYNHDVTEELRASFEVGRLSGVVGGFYQSVSGQSPGDWPVSAGYLATFGDIVGGNTAFYNTDAYLTDIQKAVFGELNFAVTSKLKATVGGRAFRQTQSQRVTADGVLQGAPADNTISSRASGFTPKYNLSYNFTDNLLAYATASKGFREGGAFVPIPQAPCAADLAALGLTQAPTQYRPDTLWNYELGAKTQWLDRRLTVNADLYDIKWKDVQQSVSLGHCGFAFTGNLGTATSKGAELEVHYEPVQQLRLGLQTAYNQAQLTSSVVGTPGVIGQELTYSPRWTGAASAEYRQPVASRATLVGRLDFNASSRQFREFNRSIPDYVQPGYSLMNARLTSLFGSWDASLYCTNLLDKRAATGREPIYTLNLPVSYRETLERPRTVGVQFTAHY